MNRFVVISGCSGGGKSTLLAELERRGYAAVEEPGRRIVARELREGGHALPWIDGAAFARKAMALSLEDRKAAERRPGRVFFDRGLIDAACALQHMTGEPALAELRHRHRYNRLAFMAPPWPEIYVADEERRHDLAAAIAEYDRLCAAYPAIGYEVRHLPKASVQARADFILAALQDDAAEGA